MVGCGRASTVWPVTTTRSLKSNADVLSIERYQNLVPHPFITMGKPGRILAVTGLDSLDFWCYWPDQPELLLSVDRDDSYIERLLDRELEFWNQVQRSV